MFQTFYNAGDETSVPTTRSTDNFIKLPESHILPQEDVNNTLKKVTSLNCGKTETKHKNKFDPKAFKVKSTIYTNAQRSFLSAALSLKNSYETVKKIEMDALPANKRVIEYDELNSIVKDVVEKEFGIRFSNDLFKRDHQIYVPSLNLPPTLDISSYTSGHDKLDLAIKKPYEDVWKYILDVSQTNMKYHFWLQKIIEPNEFSNLYDIREYLKDNMLNDEQTTVEKVESNLNYVYNNLQLKLIDIINEAVEVLQPGKYTSMIHAIKSINADQDKKALQTILDENKRQMDLKIKTLVMENEKLKRTELDYSKQIQTLLGELSFRNRKLISTKDRLALLTKEKNDLIAMIKKMEVKEEGFLSLQDRCEREQEKNRQLRSIITKKYEGKHDIRYFH